MARRTSESSAPRRPPATTLEGRENQLISLAVDLAERQLLEGTAAPATINHFLKLATTREQLEQERIRQENILLAARTENLEAQKSFEETAKAAIAAMRGYQGYETDEPED